MRFLLIIFSMLMTSCGIGRSDGETEFSFETQQKLYQAGRKMGINQITQPDQYIDGRVLEIVNEFESYYGGDVENVSIEISSKETPVCRNYGLSGYKTIFFPENYLRHDKKYQKVTLFHLMGHCVLNQYDNECNKLNIMCSRLSFDEMDFILSDWDYYVNLMLSGY